MSELTDEELIEEVRDMESFNADKSANYPTAIEKELANRLEQANDHLKEKDSLINLLEMRVKKLEELTHKQDTNLNFGDLYAESEAQNKIMREALEHYRDTNDMDHDESVAVDALNKVGGAE